MAFSIKDTLSIKTSASVKNRPAPPNVMSSPLALTKLLIQPSSTTITDDGVNHFSLSTNASILPNIDWPGRYYIQANSYKNVSGPSSPDITLSNVDFTADCYLKITGNTYESAGSGGRIMGNEDSYQNGWEFDLLSAGNSFPNGLNWGTNGAGNSVAYSFTANTLYHLALVRSGGYIKMYINGTQQGTATSVGSSAFNDQHPIRCLSRGDYYQQGLTADVYMMRFVKGLALWTSNFTPDFQPVTLT